MSAIITDDFRRNTAKALIDELKKTTSPNVDYFVGIGKSDAWENDVNGLAENNTGFSAPTPTGSVHENREALMNLIAMVKVKSDKVRHVIPYVKFDTGRRYKVYDPSDPNCFFVGSDENGTIYPCYAIVESTRKILLCLSNNGTGATSVEPTSLTTYGSVYSATDGYCWTYMTDLEDNSPLDTSQFVSIQDNDDAASADAATGGLLYGFGIVDGGSGYVAGDKFQFIGTQTNGTTVRIDLTPSVSSGAITGITFDIGSGYDISDPSNLPKDFVKGSVDIYALDTQGDRIEPTGTGAKLIPLIAPADGFGGNVIDDMPSWFVGIAADFIGDLESDGQIIDYRQISLIKNPTIGEDSDSAGTDYVADDDAVDCLRWFVVENGTPTAALSALSTGDPIQLVDDSSDAINNPVKAYFDHYDAVNGRVYFHQNFNSNVNQGDFSSTGDITDTSGNALFSYTAIVEPEYTRFTGNVIFLENRKPISRSLTQTEEIKIILQF